MTSIYLLVNSSCFLLGASGIGAAITQRVNNRYSFICAAIAFIITSVMLRDYYRNKNSGPLVLAAVCLTILHPIWTVSGNSGDMGINQMYLSLTSTAIIISLFFAMYFSRQNWRSETTQN